MLTKEEITQVFMDTHLEENYNFLQEDLVKLANAFISAAAPKIAKEERIMCVDVARSLNSLVANKMAEIRGGV